jgi:hypothetical protein
MSSTSSLLHVKKGHSLKIESRPSCPMSALAVDSGKSTTLGVLTKGKLDDGRGRARVSLFRHKHELDSGRTSSVGMEIMGCKSLIKCPQISHFYKLSITLLNLKLN